MKIIIAALMIAGASSAFSQEPWTFDQAQELFEAAKTSQSVDTALEGKWLFAAWAGKDGGEYDSRGITANLLKPGNSIYHRRDLTTWHDWKTGSLRISKMDNPLVKNKTLWSAAPSRIHHWENGEKAPARVHAGSVFFEETFPDTVGEYSKDGRYKVYPAVRRYQYECRLASPDALICQLRYEQKKTDTQTVIKESLEYRGFLKETK